MSDLAIPKGKKVKKPTREPDHISKRGKDYWWSPEWTREIGNGYGRIKAITKKNRYGDDYVELFGLSKTGNMTYIQGSIQVEFYRWHLDNEIDYILLGIEIEEVILTDWEYI